MQAATLQITLPTAPAQSISQDHREITVIGSLADGTQNVAISSNGPLTIRAGIDSQVTIGTVEVLINGKKSAPASLTFAPHDHVEAVAADPAGYAVKVISIDEVPDAQPAPVSAPDTIDPNTGRVVPTV